MVSHESSSSPHVSQDYYRSSQTIEHSSYDFVHFEAKST